MALALLVLGLGVVLGFGRLGGGERAVGMKTKVNRERGTE
jgi:hypothetical protein